MKESTVRDSEGIPAYVEALQELEALATKGKKVFDGRYQAALKNYREAKLALLN